ncbi:protein neprosin-like [Gastrolobium bilobum]|uniref:protein neprosin-like n=1 Tax=Gastrolobium bilobum TaxID=150636 RepID=UPI002AB18557|nr:protein neprosin-like [Gastrolobium bilobum]
MLLLWVMFGSYILDIKAGAGASSPLEITIEAKLKQLNKPYLKTIKSEDGDIIDCVDVYKQPAFDHPALQNHKIQMIPDFLQESHNASAKDVFQIWQRSESCPEGTIPIRRIMKEDLLRIASSNRFGMKPPAIFKNSTKTTNAYNLHFPNLNVTNGVVPEDRSAAYLEAMGQNFMGAEADINVWNPNIDLPDDFTTAQIWLKARNGIDFESVEAGWVVNPKLYGDKATRLFAYWTTDSYQSTGCFDLTCSGFVQTGTEVALGAALKPVSSDSGNQYDYNVGMYLDYAGNWWLRVRNNKPVGYWPAELFSSLTSSAIVVEWGGQVFSSNLKKTTPHTRTAMGSGNFPDGQFGHSCFMRNLRIKDNSLALKYPQNVNASAEEPNCYKALNVMKNGAEPVFYFGGPGQRPPNCP